MSTVLTSSLIIRWLAYDQPSNEHMAPPKVDEPNERLPAFRETASRVADKHYEKKTKRDVEKYEYSMIQRRKQRLRDRFELTRCKRIGRALVVVGNAAVAKKMSISYEYVCLCTI